jgi:PTH1 family peptidyl-tRNA hydrolase
MFLVVGLGNPGARYRDNRHNVGFMAVDRWATARGADPARKGFQGLHSRVRVGTHDVLLLLPQTFMNLSGQSVREAMQFFKISLEDVVVVHDELDLPFGSVRIKRGGGSAGHKGIESITQQCGGPGFLRIRIGIGRPPAPIPTERWVLGDFSAEEGTRLGDVLQAASAAIDDLIERGPEAAMNAHNRSAEASPRNE